MDPGLEMLQLCFFQCFMRLVCLVIFVATLGGGGGCHIHMCAYVTYCHMQCKQRYQHLAFDRICIHLIVLGLKKKERQDSRFNNLREIFLGILNLELHNFVKFTGLSQYSRCSIHTFATKYAHLSAVISISSSTL